MKGRKSIIVAIEGNVPSYKAHSVTTAKMADGFQDLNKAPVTFLFGGSLMSLYRRIRFGGIKFHYGISGRISFKGFHCPLSRDYYIKSIGLRGVVKRFSSFLRKNKKRIDFVYARSFRFSIACIEEGVPVIMETHASAITNIFFKELIKVSGHPCFLGIVTIHEKLKALYVEAGVPAEKVIVLHDGLSCKLFKEENLLKSKERQILRATYIGGLFEEKGIRDILSLSIMASDNGLPVEFHIYGGEPKQVKYWKSEYLKAGGGQNLNFHGFVANSLVPRILKQSDILLMPYPKLKKFDVMDINTTSPLKLFEYMASKKPILSTNIPVVSSVLTHDRDAYLGDFGDVEDHFKGLCLLVNDVNYRQELSINSYNKSFQYSWKNRAEEVYKFVHKGES